MRRLLLTLCLGACVALAAPAAAPAGTFELRGTTIVYNSAGDPQASIAGFQVGDHIRFTRFGVAGLGADEVFCHLVNDTVDCPLTGVSNVLLDMGGGDDVATVAANVTVPVEFNGGPGNDGLFGGGGLDTFAGGSGNDNIVSRDNRAEQVDCGTGNDTAISDDADTRTSCEEVEGDADRDGVRRPADCNDTNPAIHPGAVDAPNNGVDEDCSGADADDLDRDRDRSPRPQDCDDSNPAVHPGAKEVRGNGVDENCDGVVVPYAPIPGAVANLWTASGSGTRNVRLLARQFPKRTVIRVSCSGKGCPKKSRRYTVRSRTKPVSLHGFLGRRVLRKGARVQVRFTLGGHVGRVLRFRIGTPGVPDVDFLCQPPGEKVSDC